KHTNPCGFAVGEDIAEAYRRAHACDSRSAYGGVVALNRPVDAATAAELTSTFLEVLVVPGADPAAAGQLARRERMRVLSVEGPAGWRWLARARRAGARWPPPTPSSRSPTASRWWAAPAPPRSSSRAAARRTTTSSAPPTPWGWRWC